MERKKLILVVTAITAVLAFCSVVVYLLLPNSPRSLGDSAMLSIFEAKTPSGLMIPQRSLDLVANRNFAFIRSEQGEDKNTTILYYKYTDSSSPNSTQVEVRNSKLMKIDFGDNLNNPSANAGEQAQNTASHCLINSDLKGYSDASSLYAKRIRAATMEFTPTNTNYINETGGNLLLDRLAEFYKVNKSKDFRFTFESYISDEQTNAEVPTSIKNISQDRYNKLRDGLRERGVQDDRITYSTSYRTYNTPEPSNIHSENYVDIYIIDNCRK